MYEHEFLVDLYRFELTNFGVILGMDWLAKHYFQMDYPRWKITLRGPNGEKVVHKAKGPRARVKQISVMKACKLLGRGCEGFLCNVVKNKGAESSLKDNLVVRGFTDVFSEEIPGMPPLREVEFCMDLEPPPSLRHPIVWHCLNLRN